ncbi:stage III sporulation protein AF [Halobacillus karajensis]|uniref:Stage III sporulation protein AF n=1 Tax=Halobacillus karajensis TaxID=195088 RepID=A0A024P7I1_9BACI|nr:stage III sporulation protein AF [Halobacillus karajensis]CDQ17901.1 stage III sporulation protein AF [Halobacillus karajensis]CDQ24307.1 stage III sporulation protein AF [Halobacillus karajensis]CDQ29444.1 stage III sporulation protein AF [Halobacillus karajensis]SEH61996.1 stage III sporulation protein AF [Halobacillus karajensis]
MEYFIEWITKIVLFLLLAMMADALLPSGVMKKYARLVMSILLLLIFLGPLLQLLNINPERLVQLADKSMQQQLDAEMLDESVESKKNEILEGQDAYKLEQVTQALAAEIETPLKEEQNLVLVDVAMSFHQEPYSLETLDKLTLTLSREKQTQSVEDVNISIMDETVTEEEDQDPELVNWIADYLDLDKEQISIRWEDEDE